MIRSVYDDLNQKHFDPAVLAQHAMRFTQAKSGPDSGPRTGPRNGKCWIPLILTQQFKQTSPIQLLRLAHISFAAAVPSISKVSTVRR